MELAAAYAEDVADPRAILRLIVIGKLHEAAEVVDCLDTLVRDQIPIRLYDAIVLGARRSRPPPVRCLDVRLKHETARARS